MMFDGNCAIEQTGSWKKRWANNHDQLSDFGKAKRKVDVGRGEFKSYDMPINLVSIPEVLFIIESDNISNVEYLIGKHILYLGKKRSQGYGEISDFSIEPVQNERIIRPVPVRFLSENLEGELKYCAWKPPYWLPENIEPCLITFID
jgi:hypothetical protein